MASATTPFEVHLVTPDREIWSGSATFVVARSAAGDIGVLAGHEPTLSVMGIGQVKIERPEEDDLIAACDGGFLSVGRLADGTTRVDILAEHVTLEADIDSAQIAELELQSERLAAAGNDAAARAAAAKAAARRRITS